MLTGWYDIVRLCVYSILFYFSVRPLKIREEADPFSLDMGVMEKGSIVRVLEVRQAFAIDCCPPHPRV